MKEVLWATCLRIPIVLLVNAEQAKGGMSLDDARRLLAKAHKRFGDEWGLNAGRSPTPRREPIARRCTPSARDR